MGIGAGAFAAFVAEGAAEEGLAVVEAFPVAGFFARAALAASFFAGAVFAAGLEDAGVFAAVFSAVGFFAATLVARAFFAAGFFAAAFAPTFVAGAFVAEAFFAAGFFAAAFAPTFVAGAFFAASFFGAAFAPTFVAGAFFAAGFFAAAFAPAFVAEDLFATGFFAATFVAGDFFATGFFAAAFAATLVAVVFFAVDVFIAFFAAGDFAVAFFFSFRAASRRNFHLAVKACSREGKPRSSRSSVSSRDANPPQDACPAGSPPIPPPLTRCGLTGKRRHPIPRREFGVVLFASDEVSVEMELFRTLSDKAYESVHFFHDAATGLRAIVSIHDTTFGPALGGTRALSTYESEDAAVVDALRLSRGMTYKACLAGLPLGGGKAVIMLPKTPFDRTALFNAYGRAIESIGGRYITAEDSGTSIEDMDSIRKGTSHVVGLSKARGGSGDPSPFTAFGVLRGIEAVAKFSLGRSDLEGLKVSILGVGHVGFPLARMLKEKGAELWVSDIDQVAVKRAQDEFGAKAVSTAELVGLDVDVFAPCALGGTINDTTLPLLRCKAVAGSANNQLLEERHGAELQKRGIVYAPDYAINAGGLINVALEVEGYDEKKSRDMCSAIYDTIYMILERAKAEGSRPEVVADRIVEERLAAAKKAKATA